MNRQRSNGRQKGGYFLGLFLGVFWTFVAGQDSLQKKEQIQAGQECYQYRLSPDNVAVYDKSDNIIFYSQAEDENTAILNLDYSETYHSFIVFKLKMASSAEPYQLIVEGQSLTKPYIIKSTQSFYTPGWIDGQKPCLVYIGDDFCIHFIDPETQLILKKIAFPAPILDLKKEIRENKPVLTFQLFENGSYTQQVLPLTEIWNRIESGLKPAKRIKSSKSVSFNNHSLLVKKKNILAQDELDYRKFVGFGDSITYGQIGADYHPELGYIPRLQILIDVNLYAGLVINEGIPGDNTVKALERFETVLSTHLAKFLLFHLGTNDVVHLDIPISTIVYNIDYMMNKVLNINIQPVLSTLIPRNTKFNEGIFRQRAVNVSQEIRQMAYRLNIPFIDYWQIFSDYPDSDGGYDSLMSDHVHPSEKGYQLMAQEWLEELKKIPPAKPEKVIIDAINQLQARVNWAENIEPDLSHYLVEFGFSLAHLDRQEITQDTSYTFHLFPLHLPYYHKIFFTIRAVDKYGNASQPTSIYQFEFQ